MLWIILSLFFFWLTLRELMGRHSIDKLYLTIILSLALATAWPPFRDWRFERFLNTIARELAENHPATVHCNTLWDTLWDEDARVGGHADFKTGYIVIQYPRCSLLMDYLKHPATASTEELISLNILTHESMHARGERNEARTECQAVQRNYRAAKLLGVADSIAKQNALDYYNDYYLKRHDGYFSKDCAPDKALDEHLNDSTWHDE